MSDAPDGGQLAEERWLGALAAELGVSPPSGEERELLLALAGIAAHASQRTAAPLACFLVGRSGLAPEAALELARRVSGQR